MSSKSFNRLELTRRFEELRARLHSKHGNDSDGFNNVRFILERFSELHRSDPAMVHSALRSVLSLFLNDALPCDFQGRILVLDHDPTWNEIDSAYRSGIVMIVTVNGVVRAYCTYCCAELSSIAIEETTAIEAIVKNALHGKAMKESERQRKLQELIEEARKLELTARIKPPEVDYSPEKQLRKDLQEHATRLLRRLIIKVLTLGKLKYIDDNVSENLLRDAARRFVHLLLMRFKKFVEKGKGSKIMQFISSERDILNIYERCIVEFKHGGHICELIQQNTDFYANRVFDEEVKQTLLQVIVRQLLLQEDANIVNSWRICRKALSRLLSYLGGDGQCHVKSLFELIDAKIIEDNPEMFLRREVFKYLFFNRPDIVKQLFVKYPDLIGPLIESLVIS